MMWWGYGPMGWAAGNGIGWVGMIVGGVFMVVFWVAVLALAFWMAGKLLGNTEQRPRGDDALTIVKARYARGEITQEEYQRMRQELTA